MVKLESEKPALTERRETGMFKLSLLEDFVVKHFVVHMKSGRNRCVNNKKRERKVHLRTAGQSWHEVTLRGTRMPEPNVVETFYSESNMSILW